MYTENVKKIFEQDIRDKRRAGSGAFHMRGKGVRHGFSGAIRTPYTFMSTKEKKQLNSEVRIYNMYETIIPKSEFDLKDRETQRNMMIRWRELYSNSKIMNEWNMRGQATFSKLVNDLDIPKKPRIGGPRKAKSVKPKTEQLSLETVKDTVKEEVITQKPEPVKLIINGLALEYHGTFEADAINKILTKVQLLLEGEPNKFEIHISVTERD